MLPQPGHIVADAGVADLDPAVAGIGLGVARQGCGGVIEEGPDVVVQRALVALERQHVVPALPQDLLGDGALAVEGIGRDDGVLEREHGQEPRHRGDLVRLACDRELP